MFGFLMLLEFISYGNYYLLGKCYFFFPHQQKIHNFLSLIGHAFSYSSNAILVDDTMVQNEEVVDIKCGTEIIPGPDREGQQLFTL